MSTIATTEISKVNAPNEALASGSFRHIYNELVARPVVEVDVLEQLKNNLNQLDDLHARLKFMMSELNYLLKR